MLFKFIIIILFRPNEKVLCINVTIIKIQLYNEKITCNACTYKCTCPTETNSYIYIRICTARYVRNLLVIFVLFSHVRIVNCLLSTYCIMIIITRKLHYCCHKKSLISIDFVVPLLSREKYNVILHHFKCYVTQMGVGGGVTFSGK